MTILIHNTRRENARRILRDRRLIANVEFNRPYDHLGGPFFFLDDQDGSEVPSGGERHEIDLVFYCSLPCAEKRPRAEINGILGAGRSEDLKGKIVVGANDLSGAIEQAIIVPDQYGCLVLKRVVPALKRPLLKRLLGRPEDGRPFDVLLPSTARTRDKRA